MKTVREVWECDQCGKETHYPVYPVLIYNMGDREFCSKECMHTFSERTKIPLSLMKLSYAADTPFDNWINDWIAYHKAKADDPTLGHD